MEDHPLNSSWSLATSLGAEPSGGVWAVLAIYDTHTGDRIATSDTLGPQEADQEEDVYPRRARLINTDNGARLIQTLQQGVYVLDVNTLHTLCNGLAGDSENDINPYTMWLEGALASRICYQDYDYGNLQGSTISLTEAAIAALPTSSNVVVGE